MPAPTSAPDMTEQQLFNSLCPGRPTVALACPRLVSFFFSKIFGSLLRFRFACQYYQNGLRTLLLPSRHPLATTEVGTTLSAATASMSFACHLFSHTTPRLPSRCCPARPLERVYMRACLLRPFQSALQLRQSGPSKVGHRSRTLPAPSSQQISPTSHLPRRLQFGGEVVAHNFVGLPLTVTCATMGTGDAPCPVSFNGTIWASTSQCALFMFAMWIKACPNSLQTPQASGAPTLRSSIPLSCSMILWVRIRNLEIRWNRIE